LLHSPAASEQKQRRQRTSAHGGGRDPGQTVPGTGFAGRLSPCHRDPPGFARVADDTVYLNGLS
jgi:hypothetical protein